MGIQVEMITILIPVRNIVLKYRGGWDAYWHERVPPRADGIWRDEYLVRQGFMDPINAELAIEELRANGLRPVIKKDGQQHWNDLCIVMSAGPTLPCQWVYYDQQSRIVHYAEKGLIFPSEHFPFRIAN